jgi:hypothetical protein
VDGGGGVYTVEVVIVVELNVARKRTGHVKLRVASVPGSTMTAGLISAAVDKGLVVARRSESVGTFHLHTVDERGKESLGGAVRNSGPGAENVTDEDSHLLGNEFVGVGLSDLGSKIRLVNSTGRSTRHETHVGTTWNGDNGEHIFLGAVNVLDLMVVGLSNTGHTEETVLGATESENGRRIVEQSLTGGQEAVLVAEEDRSHKNGTLDFGVVGGVVLDHDTTKRVSGEEDVITFETGLSDFRNGRGNIAVNEERLRDREQEGRKTNPDSLAVGSTFIDVSLSDVGVSSVVAVGTVDPNNGDVLTLGSGR